MFLATQNPEFPRPQPEAALRRPALGVVVGLLLGLLAGCGETGAAADRGRPAGFRVELLPADRIPKSQTAARVYLRRPDGGFLCTTMDIDPRRADGPLQVVATVGMLADVVKVVAGDRAEVVSLMGPGVDPHLHVPTRRDVQALAAADLVFYGGLTLEGRMGDALDRLGRSGKAVVAVAERAIPPDRLRRPEGSGGHPDPHVWMDVSLWSLCVDVVRDALIDADPVGETGYRERAAGYRKKLAALDFYVAAVIASIPEGQRSLVTGHDAFGYFSRAYGIPVRSVQGITTDSEAGLADVGSLVSYLVERRGPAIFVETSVSPRNLRAVIAGAADRGWPVRIGGELFSDAFGSAGTYEGTYIGMIDHNATAIARALGGDAPAGGMSGRLNAVKE